ncbi:baseplate J/gp47 family protein [Zoogloea sp.]|uniref:baseplate J/gp47 family protein n=1 Tax=Zoogloea sp. TaxID=49181 RepID=UPI0026183771|nr:baseplate J/gp47 family protein [Zoogloea sp.]
MTYVRPTFDELKARIEVDLALVPAVLRGPLSAAWARACHGQHGHLAWIDAQCSPLTCDLDRLYAWAALYGVDRLAPAAAAGALAVTGAAGAQVLAGSLWRSPTGLDYEALEAVVLLDGTARVEARCTTAGVVGNLLAGSKLTLIDPVLGVDASATVMAGGLSGGADAESVDDWRIRVADEWRAVVEVGGRSGRVEDYRYWARSAHPAVTSALVQLHALGLGTVLIRPICNSLPSRLPTLAIRDDVLNYVLSRAPATADVRVASPVSKAVQIRVLLDPEVDSGTNRAAIFANLADLVHSLVTDEAELEMVAVDDVIRRVTSRYTRLAPVANLVCGPGEAFAEPTLVWG